MISDARVSRVSAPIAPGDRGDPAANLQTALIVLVARGVFRAEVAPNRPTREELDALVAKLGSEQAVVGDATRTLVSIYQVQQGLGDNRGGVVDEETAAALNRELERLGVFDGAQTFVVTGAVRDAGALPVPGLTVRALDRDLRSSELLGETQTAPDGRYEIDYAAERFAAADAGGADLQVVVLQADEELARSGIRFNAAAHEIVDVTLADAQSGLSEYERYLAQLEPVLDGVALADLREDSEHQDFSFLAAETGLPRDRIEMLSQAAAEARLPLDDAGADNLTLPQEAFYAWFRYDLARERTALLATPPSVLARTLKRAIGDRIVPSRLKLLIEELQTLLKTRRASELLRPAAAEAPASLGDVLGLAADHEALDQSQASGLALLVAERTPDEDTLARAAETLAVGEEQLRGVRRGLAMRRIAAGDAALMRAAEDVRPQLSDGCDALPFAAIAAMAEDDWSKAIAIVANGADAAELGLRAREAMDRTAELFPHDVLLAPAARRLPVDELAKLVERSDADDDAGHAAAASLAALVGAYPGLRLDEVVAGDGDAQAKAGEVDRRLAVVAGVYATNLDVPVLELDYMPDGDAGDRLDLSAVEKADRPRVIDTFKAMRRVHEVTGLASHTRLLMTAGYGSAAQLASADPMVVSAETGIEQAAAQAYVANGKTKASESAIHFFAAHGASVGQGHGSGMLAPASVAVASFFTKIPGYSELFGDTAFCNCRQCQSVLSPAAYFVDLMWFVQRTLTDKAFAGRPAGYPLRLKVRRPDLWSTLELTCENTDGLVPYLDIVNEILEAHVGSALGGAGPQHVYRRLARTTGSVSQPFHLQLERTAAYLGDFGRTRADVARVLVTDETTHARAWLGASVAVWDLLVQPRAPATTFLTTLYGSTVVQAVAAGAKVDVQDLLAATGWSRPSLGELVDAPFVRGSDQPQIASEKRDPTTSVQNDVERVSGLTAGVLDRMHRMWRLHVATGVAVPALDLVLRAVPAPPSGSDESSRLLAVVRVLEATQRLGVPLDAACALIGPIPTQPLEPGGTALFDRLFNLEPFVSQQGSWPQHMPTTFAHPSFAATGASTPDNRTLQRLLAGLQVSDAELVELLTILGLASAASPSTSLTLDVLVLLFRHALLARALDVPVADFGRLLRLARVGRVNAGTAAAPWWANRIATLDDVRDLFAAVDDWRSGGVSLDDAEFVIEGHATQPRHLQAPEVAAALAEQLARERPWELADTLLASIRGISEADSRQILRENTAQSAADDPTLKPLETPPGSSMLRIRAAVDPQASGWTLALPAGYTLPTGVSASDLSEAVAGFDALGAVGEALAVRLGVPRAKLTQLLRLAGPSGAPSQPLESSRAAAVAAAYAGDATLLEAALLTGRPALLPLAVVFGTDEWDAAAVQRVADDHDQTPPLGIVFDSASIDLSWRAVVEARLFRSLAREPLDPAAGDDALRPDRAALTRVLAIDDWSTAANDVDLGAALAVDRARIAALRPNLPLASLTRPMRRLESLRSALRLAALLGISGETLRTIVPAVAAATGGALVAAADKEYDALAQAADALYGVLRTVYPDAAVFEERLAPFEDLMRGRRRDALVDFLLHPGDVTLPLTFASVSELYGYFLLDVEMGGCARTSRIVAATQSVQLYVHRVLMALEAGMWDSAPKGTRERAISDVRAQWDWRQHYRVWEANRRIFLFPESYLEPELRDDRTPLFDEVAAELLQQETTEAAVTAAYTRYLAGLDELIGLRVAGLYREVSPDGQSAGDLLHIVAATSSDPPEHYYRTARNLWAQFDKPPGRPVFSAWEKMKVHIPARDVTPVVFRGRLYLFWLEIATRPVNELVAGNSNFVGYDHRVAAKFTVRQSDGSWAAPQPLALFEAPGVIRQILHDRLIVKLVALGNETLGGTSTKNESRKIPLLADAEGIEDSHPEPQEGYTVPGPVLPFVHVDLVKHAPDDQELHAAVADLVTDVDLFRREALAPNPFNDRIETIQVDDVLALSDWDSSVELYANRLTHDGFSTSTIGIHAFVARTATQRRDVNKSWQVPLATLPARTRGVLVRQALAEPPPGRLGFDLVAELDRQPVLALAAGGGNQMVRLGSGLGSSLSEELFDAHLAGLLSTGFQEDAVEPELSVNPISGRVTLPPTPPTRGQLDLDGPVATYLREVWFEFPYLIANHLNGQQRFAAAQRWYHYLFDPTSAGAADDVDRVWRYRGFRGVSVQSLRDALVSGAALDAYRFDPFSPHAIARLRPGAHKKAVVMKYLDNLLDWGDALFAEFTRESLNEATMLYVLAADILGPRPPDIGDCGEGAVQPRTYATIEPYLGATSDFLIELELFARPQHGHLAAGGRRLATDKVLLSDDVTYSKRSLVALAAAPAAMLAGDGLARNGDGFASGVPPTGGSLWRGAGGTPVTTGSGPQLAGDGPRISTSGNPVNPSVDTMRGAGVELKPFGDDTVIPFDYRPLDRFREPFHPKFDQVDPHLHEGWKEPPVIGLVEQAATRVPVFCIPPNRELLAYWDRVADRLNKIRNCMDITGARRQPSLFAPEIDPLLLARARAAGLSLDEVLSLGSGSVPPYRFAFLIERARQYAESVQAFANALLAALEKKDAEELTRLRNVHELNLLRLRTRTLEWEVAAAEDTTAALVRQRDAVEYRRGYYATLRATPLNGWEQTEEIARHSASLSHIVAATISFGSAIAKSVPNAGSPFAMTYGGIQIGGTLGQVAGAFASLAAAAEAVSASAGLEATFGRRSEEWQHQQKLAELELLNLDRQILASQIRGDIAQRSLEIHERSIEQAEDVLALEEARFTSLDRYTQLAARLHRVHREAFNTALGVARMAERAFQFERGDDGAVALAGGYWDASDAGLGAGDALLVDLQRLEQRYLETNLRTLEVEQSFSLATYAPRALLALRETGRCTFSIPETPFDLAYPGQYRRRIKAVRLSIPCVTGPHVNVSATLRLTGSSWRQGPKLPLMDVPLRHTTAIAASSAQSDGGVFEFTFRDDRFLPFEGAGAVSDWALDLPTTLRAFDYRTITDVILRIGYTAEHDEGLRADIEAKASSVAVSLRHRLETDGLPLLLSVRQDAPEAWRALLDAPAGTEVTMNVDARHVPGTLADWLNGRALPSGTQPGLLLSAGSVALVIQGPAARTRPTAMLAASFGTDTPASLAFGATPGTLGLYEASLAGSATLEPPATGPTNDPPNTQVAINLRVDSAGSLAPGPDGISTATIDAVKLRDIVILSTVKLKSITP